jgi:hypothetical protein
MNKGTVDSIHGRDTVRNLQRTQISPDLGQRSAQRYFTLTPRPRSVRKAPTMVSQLPVRPYHLTQSNENASTRSHTHGNNRNRLALDVILNGSRNVTRRR